MHAVSASVAQFTAKAPKWLKEFDNLIKQIGESKSKAEEDRIITAELELLKQRLLDPKLDKSRGREYMVRLMYCEMLGHDASWAYIKALQFCSEPSVQTKKAAYLALTQFLDHNNELVLLLVNTLLSDMKSDNYIVVSTALVVTTRLIGADLINAVYPGVVSRLTHPREHVRKKAIMALHRFHQLDPTHEMALSGVDLDKHFRLALCDKDPSVMSAALCALHEVIKANAQPYKNLIPSFTSILKQVSEHRLPKTYDYHRFPAPFIQIKLLKVLAALGAGDRSASDNMYAVIQQTLRRANSSHTIGNAIIYECVKTITTIYPNPTLLAAAAESIAMFLKSTSHNLKYMGIDALAGIVKINAKYAQEHQLAVIDCLEDPDDTLKLKTLELLYKMTKSNNVEVIVERMMSYLRTTTDEHIKRDIVSKVRDLAERYAPDPQWFIAVMSEVFELGGEHVDPSLGHNLLRLVAEQSDDLHMSAVDIYLDITDKPDLPQVLQMVICWVLGEYGALACQGGTRHQLTPQELMDKLCTLQNGETSSPIVQGFVLYALAKVVAQTGAQITPLAEELMHKASVSHNVELQQRAFELQALLSTPRDMLAAVLPPDASCEEFDEDEMSAMRGLTFLDAYVQQALQQGAAPYAPEDLPSSLASSYSPTKNSQLRFEAYEPTAPPTAAIHSTPYNPDPTRRQGLDFLDLSSSPASSAYSYPAPSQSSASQPSTLYESTQPAASRPPPNPNEPHLHLAASGPRRWGPAQFESSRPTAAATSAPTAPSSIHTLPTASPPSSLPSTPASSYSASTARPQAAPHRPAAQLSEREKAAAAIFGGGGGAAAGSKFPQYRKGPASSTASPNHSASSSPTRHAAPAAVVDLLDFGPSSPAKPPPGQRTDLDLLLDMDGPPVLPPGPQAPVAVAPPPVAAPADPFAALDGLTVPPQPLISLDGQASIGPSGGLMPGIGGQPPYTAQAVGGYQMPPQGFAQPQPGVPGQPPHVSPRPAQPKPPPATDPFKDLFS